MLANFGAGEHCQGELLSEECAGEVETGCGALTRMWD